MSDILAFNRISYTHTDEYNNRNPISVHHHHHHHHAERITYTHTQITSISNKWNNQKYGKKCRSVNKQQQQQRSSSSI